jgi:hypothetical protein
MFTYSGELPERKVRALGACMAGPAAGLLFAALVPLLFPLFLILLLPFIAFASSAALSEDSQTCLNCHGAPGMVMTLGDKTTVSVHVDGDRFARSVHGALGCAGCHGDISLDNHPSATYATKQQFLQHLASACRTCHADGQLMANPLHQRAITRANAPPCSACHSAHAIIAVSSRKKTITTSQYCLTCHTQALSRSIQGERISLTLDEGWIKGSVHKNHECSDCHTAYSKENHPPPARFANARELSLAISETCKRCHFDTAVQYTDSVHFTLSAQGNQQAPVCTDCHGAHQVGPPALAETMAGVPCKTCHQEIFAAYQESVHGRLMSGGTGNPPLCAGCHSAHRVKPAMASRSPKEMCLSCHPTYNASHRLWLPNPQAHFEMVACTACHVPPGSKRSIYLRLTDKGTGRLLTDTAVRKLLDARGIADRRIDPQELWWINRKLSEDYAVGISVAVSMNDSVHAHHLRPKDQALRKCEGCHSAASSFFDSVAIAAAGPDGREVHHAVDPKILSSVYGVPLLKRFYVMSGTRITAMDYAGLAMILGGMAVPVVHGAARMMTARRRQERRNRDERRG